MRLNRLDQEIEDMLACRKRALDEKAGVPVLLTIGDGKGEEDYGGHAVRVWKRAWAKGVLRLCKCGQNQGRRLQAQEAVVVG